MKSRKYAFSWKLLGDFTVGRPNLGNQVRLELYRLMQYTFRDVIEQRYGTEAADEVFHAAGRLAGLAFYEQMIGPSPDFSQFIRKVQESFRELGVGVLRIEEAGPGQESLVLTLEEDLDCSGLPELDYEVCKYDEGFLAGLLEAYSGRRFQVTEIECWCTGDRTCRFRAEVMG